MFVAKLKVPKTFLDDGRGVGVDYDPGELEADVVPGEDAFDYEDPEEHDGSGGDGGLAEAGGVADDEFEEADEDQEQSAQRVSPEEELDMTGPETVNLIFATAIPDNKGATVLEAIQDVVMYCWSLNIPVVRFHCDRGMEFYAKVIHSGHGNTACSSIRNQGVGQKERVWWYCRAGEAGAI
ncbi:unnamed protein product [Symbiodinium sp. CCMP2456]|nr:unnamed protein product [Symbiodinium sp. CCMP2456]